MTVEELEAWFTRQPKPVMPIYLNAATKINDYDYFLSSHLIGIKHASNEKMSRILLDRLLDLKLLMEVS